MRGDAWRSSIFVCVVMFSRAWSAAAQTTQTPKWEVEFHGGGLFSTNPKGGTISLPAPGQPFMTVAATLTTSPLPSRYEPSWYFGDGTLLFNQAATALGQLPDQIVALDPVLARPLAEHRGGGSVGVRVSRMLTPRVTAELSVDFSPCGCLSCRALVGARHSDGTVGACAGSSVHQNPDADKPRGAALPHPVWCLCALGCRASGWRSHCGCHHRASRRQTDHRVGRHRSERRIRLSRGLELLLFGRPRRRLDARLLHGHEIHPHDGISPIGFRPH
jgi:hypothetical protein